MISILCAITGPSGSAGQDQDGNNGAIRSPGNITSLHGSSQPVNIQSSLDVLGILQDSSGVVHQPCAWHVVAALVMAVLHAVNLAF